MTLKKIYEGTKGESITISVDWNTTTRTVECVNYVHVQKGNFGADITEIFIEQMNGDAIIDKIDWSSEWVEEREYNNAFCNE